MEGYTRALMELDEHALHHNISILRRKARTAYFMAIVKANAYGHGLLNIAFAIRHHVDGFGVACLDEALVLRKSGIQNKIVVLNGAFSLTEYVVARTHNVDMVIHRWMQYEWWKKCPPQYPETVWLKVNTGLNRLGLSTTEAESILAQLQRTTQVQSLVLMSHLSSADCAQDPATVIQKKAFATIVQRNHKMPISFSLANSAALLTDKTIHYDWVRSGLVMYGVSPFTPFQTPSDVLRPVMTLRAKIIATRILQPSDAVGYYGRVKCQKVTRIAIVGFGYGDGYPYNAPDGTPVLLHQRRVPLIGQVSMDTLTINITHQPRVDVGDEVTLWGKGLNIEEIGKITGRSCYELLCGVQRNTHPRLRVKMI